MKSINFNFQRGQKIVNISQLSDTVSIVCLRDRQKLLINLTEEEKLNKIASIDCLDVGHAICISASSQSLIIGTGDGHIYQLPLKKGHLVMIHDLQQPVASILPIAENALMIVGKYGKIVKLDTATKQAVSSYAPTSITSVVNSGNKLFLQGPGVLYSLELKGDLLGEPKYCKVKFVRRFQLTSQSTLIILTEDGSIYQSSLHFGTEKTTTSVESNGTDIKTIIQKIHQGTDRIKELGQISEEMRHNVRQLSVALEMVGSIHTDKFPTVIRSFACDDGSERLRISITNSSPWSFPSSHWTCSISVLNCNHSAVVLVAT